MIVKFLSVKKRFSNSSEDKRTILCPGEYICYWICYSYWKFFFFSYFSLIILYRFWNQLQIFSLYSCSRHTQWCAHFSSLFTFMCILIFCLLHHVQLIRGFYFLAIFVWFQQFKNTHQEKWKTFNWFCKFSQLICTTFCSANWKKKFSLYKKYFLLYNSHCLGCLSDQPCPRNIGD